MLVEGANVPGLLWSKPPLSFESWSSTAALGGSRTLKRASKRAESPHRASRFAVGVGKATAPTPGPVDWLANLARRAR